MTVTGTSNLTPLSAVENTINLPATVQNTANSYISLKLVLHFKYANNNYHVSGVLEAHFSIYSTISSHHRHSDLDVNSFACNYVQMNALAPASILTNGVIPDKYLNIRLDTSSDKTRIRLAHSFYSYIAGMGTSNGNFSYSLNYLIH